MIYYSMFCLFNNTSRFLFAIFVEIYLVSLNNLTTFTAIINKIFSLDTKGRP